MKHQETSRVLQMGERLIASFHYASDMIRARNVELRGRWEGISKLCEGRLSLLSLSVVFHDKQQKVRMSHGYHVACTVLMSHDV